MTRGLIHVYTGDGKGKTTAAVGLCVRAAGSGLRVLFAQFLKGRKTGEIAPLEKIGVDILRSEVVKKFIPDMTQEERAECRTAQKGIFEKARKSIPDYDLVVLDEVFGAIATGMVDKEEVIRLIREKPEGTELVMTGRDAPKEIIELADYVSEIGQIKHPYEKGINARKGIEY
ncbi:cob(I)yrinic acid a,c-diamide adenosyltransferase [[Clostridium] cellulosi]